MAGGCGNVGRVIWHRDVIQMNVDASVIGVVVAVFLALFGFLWIINTRLSRLESDTEHIKGVIGELRQEVRDNTDQMRDNMDQMRDNMDRMIAWTASHRHAQDGDGEVIFPVPPTITGATDDADDC